LSNKVAALSQMDPQFLLKYWKK